MATAPAPRFPWSDDEMRQRVGEAVKAYWRARSGQAGKQRQSGVTDAGTRGEVTGGQHLNSFVDLLCDVAREAGFDGDDVRIKSGVEIPGYFRPTKKWDIVVLRDNRLCAAMEMKSQVGPSFGNNFNNRTEEAVGSSTDLWRAYKGGFLGAHSPWLGYFFFLEEDSGSTQPVKVAKAAFPPDPIFTGTSYAKRYEILCQRMLLERNYSAASLLISPKGVTGAHSEPQPELTFTHLAKSLYGHLIACA